MHRTAIITGAGTGIGKAVAARLFQRGDQVVLVGRRKEPLVQAAAELGPRAHAVPGDATGPDSLRGLLDALPGRIDVLVNAAGGNTDLRWEPSAGLEGLRDGWMANSEANVLSAVLMTEAVRPRLADYARIVNLGSVTARSGQGSSGAVTAALEPWTSELAFQLGERGITANVVSPGPPKARTSSRAGTSRPRGASSSSPAPRTGGSEPLAKSPRSWPSWLPRNPRTSPGRCCTSAAGCTSAVELTVRIGRAH